MIEIIREVKYLLGNPFSINTPRRRHAIILLFGSDGQGGEDRTLQKKIRENSRFIFSTKCSMARIYGIR